MGVFHKPSGIVSTAQEYRLNDTAIHDRKPQKLKTEGRDEGRASDCTLHACDLLYGRHYARRATHRFRLATPCWSSPPPHPARLSLPRPSRRALESDVPSVARFAAPAKRRD